MKISVASMITQLQVEGYYSLNVWGSGVQEAVQKWEGYLSYQDTFVWRKIKFLWSDSKN